MSLDGMNLALEISTALVVVGVLLEGAEYAKEVREKGLKTDSYKLVERIGFALLVIGLAGEWVYSSKISEHQNKELISLQATASNQRTTIGQQQAKIIALETRLTPRTVTTEQYAAIQSLRGKVRDVSILASPDTEPAFLSAQLQEALFEAGISVNPIPALPGDRWVGTQICLPHNESSKNSALWMVFSSKVFSSIDLNLAPCSLGSVTPPVPQNIPLLIIGERKMFFPNGQPKSVRLRIYPGMARRLSETPSR